MLRLRLLLVFVVLAGGCSRTFKGVAVQPNPLVNQRETLRESEKITIVRGDMELEEPDEAHPAQRASVLHNHRYPLFNEAMFTLVSRDRLRFHVQVDHKWEEYADLKTWQVYLVDDPHIVTIVRQMVDRMTDQTAGTKRRRGVGA